MTCPEHCTKRKSFCAEEDHHPEENEAGKGRWQWDSDGTCANTHPTKPIDPFSAHETEGNTATPPHSHTVPAGTWRRSMALGTEETEMLGLFLVHRMSSTDLLSLFE